MPKWYSYMTSLCLKYGWSRKETSTRSRKGVLTDACSGALVLPETDPVPRDSSFPSMWHDWLLDLQQIVNNRQLSIMISEQVEVLLSYMINLKVSEGE